MAEELRFPESKVGKKGGGRPRRRAAAFPSLLPERARSRSWLLRHRKVESKVRYLGNEVDDALTIAEQVDV